MEQGPGPTIKLGLLCGLDERDTALGYLETLLRYLAAAASQLTEERPPGPA